jgi:hypothetical protein
MAGEVMVSSDEVWLAWLKSMAASNSKPFTGTCQLRRGYKKAMRLRYRRMLKRHRRLKINGAQGVK